MTGGPRDPILQLEKVCYILHKNDVGQIEVHPMETMEVIVDYWDEAEYNAKVETALNDILKLPRDVLEQVI